MPNWCVGTLKIRGEKENMRNFLLDAFVVPGSIVDVIKGTHPSEREVEEDEDYLRITAGQGRVLHVKGSRRNFVECDIEWYKDEPVLVLDSYQGAWAIDTAVLTALSKEYGVDLKIYAFEQGMEYNLDFEVHKGEVIKNNEITFDDYRWECPCPRLGG